MKNIFIKLKFKLDKNLIKKTFKIFSINFILLLMLLLSFEFIFIVINYPREKEDQELHYKFNNENKKYTFITHLIRQKEKISQYTNYYNIRDINNYSYNYDKLKIFRKNSIILLGCSFTYGQHLEDKFAFHSILSKYTKRPVYNLGVCGGGARESLFLLRNKDIINKTIKNHNVDYVIYTYIPDQRRRLYTDITNDTPHFKKINQGNSLKFYRGNIYFYRTYTYRNITNFIYMKLIKTKTSFNLFNLYIKEINKEIKKLYGNNTKFVILLYDCSENDIHFFDDLSKEGIIIINLNDILEVDIFSEEYRISDADCHPNAKAWEVIVPSLIKELNL